MNKYFLYNIHSQKTCFNLEEGNSFRFMKVRFLSSRDFIMIYSRVGSPEGYIYRLINRSEFLYYELPCRKFPSHNLIYMRYQFLSYWKLRTVLKLDCDISSMKFSMINISHNNHSRDNDLYINIYRILWKRN